jgi:hypothetical protein
VWGPPPGPQKTRTDIIQFFEDFWSEHGAFDHHGSRILYGNGKLIILIFTEANTALWFRKIFAF